MAKIKITKEQAIMLENLNRTKTLKITESQYNEILRHEGLGEGAEFKQVTGAMAKISPSDAKEFSSNVKKIAKPGLFKESEELWKEFVNELYGLHESESGKYKKLIKLMEACGYIENNKLSKSIVEGDIKKLKEVLLSGLHKLEESGSPYMAMQEIDETLDLSRDMKKNELYKGLIERWLESNSNLQVEKQYKQGNYLLAYKLARNLGNVGKEEKPEPTMVNFGESEINEYDENSAPWNEPDQPEDPMTNTNKNWDVLRYDESKNYVILKNKHDGKSYALNVDIIPEDLYYSEEFGDRINLKTINSTDWKSIGGFRSKNIIANFVSDNLKELISPENYGNGNPEELFMDGKTFVKLPESVDEVTTTAALGSTSILQPLGSKPEDYIIKKPIEENDETYNYIADELGLTSDEFDEALNNSMAELDIIERIYFSDSYTSGEKLSIIADILKLPHNPGNQTTMSESAFDETLVDGGEFVEFDDCTKLNNNKEAQKGGCSTGAIDNVVKLKKTPRNVNAPSLGK